MGMIIATPEERLRNHLGIVGDWRDESRLELGNCKDKGLRINGKRVLYCQTKEGQEYKRMTSVCDAVYYSQRSHGI